MRIFSAQASTTPAPKPTAFGNTTTLFSGWTSRIWNTTKTIMRRLTTNATWRPSARRAARSCIQSQYQLALFLDPNPTDKGQTERETSRTRHSVQETPFSDDASVCARRAPEFAGSRELPEPFLKDMRSGVVLPLPKSPPRKSPPAPLRLCAGSVTVRNRSSIRFEAPTLSKIRTT